MTSETKNLFTGKIAVATDDYKTVTGHIGRCNGFIIYELDKNIIVNSEQKENTFTHHKIGEHHHGGHDHPHGHARLIDALAGCSHLICTSAGWRVVEDLKNNNIEVVFTDEVDAEGAVQKFVDGTLIINEDGTCHTH